MLFPVFNKLYFILWPFGSIFLCINSDSVSSTAVQLVGCMLASYRRSSPHAIPAPCDQHHIPRTVHHYSSRAAVPADLLPPWLKSYTGRKSIGNPQIFSPISVSTSFLSFSFESIWQVGTSAPGCPAITAGYAGVRYRICPPCHIH